MSAAAPPDPDLILLIISSPSGAGKPTLTHRLLQEFPEPRFRVSHTTRQPRAARAKRASAGFVVAILSRSRVGKQKTSIQSLAISTPMMSCGKVMGPVLDLRGRLFVQPPQATVQVRYGRQTSPMLRDGLQVQGRVGVSPATTVIADLEETRAGFTPPYLKFFTGSQPFVASCHRSEEHTSELQSH